LALIALLSILPVILFAYAENGDHRPREQEGAMAGQRSHSRAAARAFIVDQAPAEAARPASRSAQLVGFGPETGPSTRSGTQPGTGPALSAPPFPGAVPLSGPVTAGLEPPASGPVRAPSANTTSSASLLGSSVWENGELQIAMLACLALLVLAIVIALNILRNLRRFRDAACEIALGRIGDNALISRTGVHELSGVARVLDRLVFDLRYMSEQMRLTATENAHSMRTPLATMRTAMGAIRRSLPADEPRAQRALKIIDISLDRLSSVVNSTQRNDTAMADLVARPRSLVDLSELTHDVADSIGERAKPRNIRILEKLEDGIIVHAGADALKAALVDVVSSAVDASPRYGEIVVRLERRGTAARFVVEDAGGDAATPELFFQHDFSPSSEDGDECPGRLGLWNVKRIVEAFGGEVAAERSQHGGAAVSIVLPADRH
jgi:two-component system sensor histidine kinase ChvG